MAGLSFRKLSCPNCGAPLPVADGAARVECRYCHQPIEVRREAPPPGPIANTRVVYVSSRRGPSVALLVGALLAVLLLTILGVAVAVMSGPAATIALPTIDAPFPRGGEHLQWHTIGPVFPVHLNDDAAEDVVGPYRILTGAKLEVFVGAFDGATRARLWGAGPFVSAEELQHLHVSLSGNRVAVSDARATLHLLDARTGKAVATATLSDRAKRICGAPGGAARFYVETVDESGVLVDADGAVTAGPRPAFCRDLSLSSNSSDCERLPHFGGPELPCLPLDRAPKVKGLDAKLAVGDEHHGVLLGVRSPGSRVPMAAGYDAKSGELRWSRLVPTVDPLSVKETAIEALQLSDGTLYAFHELAKGPGRLLAIDMKTGETRWEVEVPNSDEGIAPKLLILGRDRVYVPHWTWLDVFDRKTGEHLGTFGRWR